MNLNPGVCGCVGTNLGSTHLLNLKHCTQTQESAIVQIIHEFSGPELHFTKSNACIIWRVGACVCVRVCGGGKGDSGVGGVQHIAVN